jgi:N-acetylglutamate synthase-like GNAT family acetyltransferase
MNKAWVEYCDEHPHKGGTVMLAEVKPSDYSCSSLSFMRYLIQPGWLELDRIEVHDTCRNRGVGSRLMKAVCSAADQEQVALFLWVLSDQSASGLSDDQLQAWYTKFGFVLSDKVIGARLMIRLPQKVGVA